MEFLVVLGCNTLSLRVVGAVEGAHVAGVGEEVILVLDEVFELVEIVAEIFDNS